MSFSAAEKQTFENIKSLYFGSYIKRAFHNATRAQKFFYNISQKPALRIGMQCLTALPLALAAGTGVLGTVGIVLSVGILQRKAAHKWGVNPIQKKAEVLFEEGMLSGEIYKSYAELIHQENVNSLENMKNKIYSPEHEMMRLKSLSKTFNQAYAERLVEQATQGIEQNKTFKTPSQQR